MTLLGGEQVWSASRFGHDYPVSLSETLSAVDQQIAHGAVDGFRPLRLGFSPLDEILGGGMRSGDLMIVGGAYGVGKTIFALQAARNVASQGPDSWALYICYEHEPAHLMSRLLCLESAVLGLRQDAFTLRKLDALMYQDAGGHGLVAQLRRSPRYARVLEAMQAYTERLVFVRASGNTGTVTRIREWVDELRSRGATRILVAVDYVQKIPISQTNIDTEEERTILVIQALKELAISTGSRVLGLAAMTQRGLQSRRMRLTDLRGGTALQYEADIGLVLHNKHDIVSREHLVYNANDAEQMRRWLVMSVEKNRAGASASDLEFPLDAAHFYIVPEGNYVRDRLVDERIVLE